MGESKEIALLTSYLFTEKCNHTRTGEMMCFSAFLA